MFKTYLIKTQEVNRKWHLIDANEKILGRLATEIATLLIGKHKKDYTPHIDCGDIVVITNSKNVKVTGNKEKGKIYYRHSGYPGGLRSETLASLRAKAPNKIIQLAVKNMLPDNKLKAKRLKRLRIFPGEVHPYTSQLKGEVN